MIFLVCGNRALHNASNSWGLFRNLLMSSVCLYQRKNGRSVPGLMFLDIELDTIKQSSQLPEAEIVD